MAERFRDILTKTFHYSTISFAFLLAKEHGIFTTLLNADKPLTCEEIAKDNGIKERYTKEILGCLSSVELVRVSSNTEGVLVYDFEAPAKQLLVEEPTMPNLNFIMVLMIKYKEVRDCLPVGKPSVSRYSQEYFNCSDEIRQKTSSHNITFILDNIPELREKLEKGIDVLEIGCGTAHMLSVLAPMFPNSTFHATDIRPDIVELIKEKFCHVPNITFDVLDIMTPQQTVAKQYDWVLSINMIHDLPHPLKGMKNVRKIVKDNDGVFAFLDVGGTGSHLKDVGNVGAASLYSLSTFFCLPESFQAEDSEAHGANWAKETALGFAKTAGFDTSIVSMNGSTCLFIARPV